MFNHVNVLFLWYLPVACH